MSRKIQTLAVFGIDVLVIVSLVVIARIGAGWCRENLTPNVDYFDGWYCLWLVPLCLYAWWRGVAESRAREWLASVMLVFATAQTLILCGIPRDSSLHFPVFMLLIVVAQSIFDRFRRSEEAGVIRPTSD